MICYSWTMKDVEDNILEIYRAFGKKKLLWLIPTLILAIAGFVGEAVFKIRLLSGVSTLFFGIAIYIVVATLRYKNTLNRLLVDEFLTYHKNGKMEYTLDYCDGQYICCNTTRLTCFRFTKAEIKKVKITERLVMVVFTSNTLQAFPNTEEVRAIFA